MKKNLILFAICFLLSANAINVLGWDSTAHKTVAYIAWANMSPKARKEAIDLLMNAPADSGIQKLFPDDSRPLDVREMEFFVGVSVWADTIRADPSLRAKYSHPNWHYADFFWRMENGLPVEAKEINPQMENVFERVDFFYKSLSAKVNPPAERAIELAWIIHLLGDIHQPLHLSSRISYETPRGDQGGNLFELTPKDTPREQRVNLHSYWDSILTSQIPRKKDEDLIDYIKRVSRDATKKHPLSQMTDYIKSGQFYSWARDGFKCASAFYTDSPTLTNEYRDWAFTLSKSMISLAGYRLANSLNEIFDPETLKKKDAPAETSLESDLDNDFTCIYNRFDYRTKELKVISGSRLNGQKITGYDAKEFRTIINQTKAEILLSLDRKKLSGMKDYVDKYFPLVNDLPTYKVDLRSSALNEKSFSNAPVLSFQNPAPDIFAEKEEIFEIVSANKALKQVKDFLAELIEQNDQIQLEIVTSPGMSNVTLQTKSGVVYTVSTDQNGTVTINDFYRGTYDITVSRDGYEIVYDSEDFWKKVKGLSCTLVIKQDPRLTPLSCNKY